MIGVPTEADERRVTIERAVRTSVEPSMRVLETAAAFGLGVDEERTISVVPRTEVAIPQGGVVFVTGPSGGGKSTILRLIDEACGERGWPVVRFDVLPELEERPLVDLFEGPGLDLAAATKLLAMAGLGDAFVMLRMPGELSDGQRYRLKLAQTMALAAEGANVGAEASCVVLADEFGATLDRTTAMNVARNAARWARRSGHALVCATTHDDLLEALEPEVLVYKGLGETIEVVRR